MNKIYEKQTWHNDAAPALSEDNLNHIENGIDAIDSRLVGLTPADIGAVPNTRTVNNHALNEDISLSASDVGLGNVPNVTTNNQTPTFNEASTRANIASGESLSTLFGKIKKWFTDLKTVAFTGSFNDLTDQPIIPPGVTVDQTYDPTSTDAQSGTAVSQAIDGITPGYIGISSANTITSDGNHVYNFDSSKTNGWYTLATIGDDQHSVVILRILITDPDQDPDTQEDSTMNGFLVCHTGDVENMGLSFYGVSKQDPYFTAFRVINDFDESPRNRVACLQIKKEPNSTYYANSKRKITFSKYYGDLLVSIANTPVKYEPSDWETEAYLSIPDGYSTNAILNEIIVGNITGNAVTSSATSGSDKLITSGGVHQALTDGSVTKIGTGNVGSATQPVYINGGVPTPGMNFGITTGTPTNVNSGLTLKGNSIKKAGNVVNFWLWFGIGSGFSPQAATTVCTLPYKPAVTYPQASRVAGPSNDNSAHYFGACYINSNGNLALGYGDFTGITSGNELQISGSYITND